MKLQVLLFTATILIAAKPYPKALSILLPSLSSTTSIPATAQSTSAWQRLHLFGRLSANVTDNNKMASRTSVTTDQDLARDLPGLVIAIVMLLSFAILTIVVGEGFAWRNERAARGPHEDALVFEA
jgi:hypothetical protein